MTVVLAADCVSRSFGSRRVLTSATLRATTGELRVLLGRNGTGKSTLLKIAAGCVQPDAGCVHVDGVAYSTVRLPWLAARGVFYISDHDLLSAAFTVRQQLEMLRAQREGGGVEGAARLLGVEALLDAHPHRLSGGERRRAELAAAVVARPRCLLADEPYRGIAPADAELLTAAFRGMAEQGTAVVVTGHEVPTLLDAADHVTWCTDGTTYELGPRAAALRHERFRREYLGVQGA